MVTALKAAAEDAAGARARGLCEDSPSLHQNMHLCVFAYVRKACV